MKLFLPFIKCVLLLLLSSFNALAEAPEESDFLSLNKQTQDLIGIQTQQGIIIPQAALIWHLGQSFVYVQRDEDEFKRVKINQKTRFDSGHYFIPHGLQENDRLVISGAQALLSEEFRGQIPAEDGHDDD